MGCWWTIKIRPLWRHYYSNSRGVVFVVDSNDTNRLNEARDELQNMLKEEELNGADVLIFANKQDLPNAMSVSEITEGLGLNDLTSHKWHIQACCATTGDGIYEGLDWLSASIKTQN
eukprot:TRINITY_DN17118_c1_g1_i1.p1 TRINITY_DN17118_c1_g1~~TRINITY_DN17118_c1_g1_i1.p1  ORF type:complete len:117 (+),score=25.27 TRINITY_DN17118_c1_g1_i1:44-394(+)